MLLDQSLCWYWNNNQPVLYDFRRKIRTWNNTVTGPKCPQTLCSCSFLVTCCIDLWEKYSTSVDPARWKWQIVHPLVLWTSRLTRMLLQALLNHIVPSPESSLCNFFPTHCDCLHHTFFNTLLWTLIYSLDYSFPSRTFVSEKKAKITSI